MLRINELIINGKSTADLPFYCAVLELDPPQKSEKKDKLFETDFASGYSKQSVRAYSGIEKQYKFYLYDMEETDIQEFKTFIADEGWFRAWGSQLKYVFVKSTLEFSHLDDVGGYEVLVTFSCQPFGLQDESTKNLDNRIYNPTNAPMYPFIEIRGAIGTETYLQIGSQRMTFKEIQDVIYIECKPHYQDVYSSGGRKLNAETKGPFFEIQPGENEVLKGPGITSIKITERWGWR